MAAQTYLSFCKRCGEQTEHYNNNSHGRCVVCKKKNSKLLRRRYRESNAKKTQAEIYNGTLKKCPPCKDLLPRESKYWSMDKSSSDGLSGRCAECDSLANSKYEANKKGERFNPEGLTGRDLRVAKQKNPNCRLAFLGNCAGVLCWDHNHTTGRIRGLLCDSHNKDTAHVIDRLTKGKTRKEAIEDFTKALDYFYSREMKLEKQTITVSIPIASNTNTLSPNTKNPPLKGSSFSFSAV